jgi:hypothetical protein
MGVLFLVGAACWSIIDPRDHVFRGDDREMPPAF